VEIILAVATILGGLTALWFFWDRISAWWTRRNGPTLEGALPLAAAPSRDRIIDVILKSGPRTDWHSNTRGSRTVTSYTGDANLRFEINCTRAGTQADDFQEPWANCHPDSRATGYWCQLFYGTSVIGQWVLALISSPRSFARFRLGSGGSRPITGRSFPSGLCWPSSTWAFGIATSDHAVPQRMARSRAATESTRRSSGTATASRPWRALLPSSLGERIYNEQRFSMALNGRTPAEKLAAVLWQRDLDDAEQQLTTPGSPGSRC
jgi:hypothetical protein